jgi:hypothetical protein
MSTDAKPDHQAQVHGLTALFALSLLGAGLLGCKTAGYQQSDAAAMKSQAASAETHAEIRELDHTLAALTNLVFGTVPDARPKFVQFSAALDQLASTTRRAGNDVRHTWSKRGAYLEIWDKEVAGIRDEEIRKASLKRRAEVISLFDRAGRQYLEAQRQLQILVNYLHDIRTALSTDLTREGLAAAEPSVRQAMQRGQEVQAVLAQAAAELDDLSARTASFRVREPEQKTEQK